MCINFFLLCFPGEWRRAYYGPRIIMYIYKNQKTQDCSDLETIYQNLCGLLKNITFRLLNVSATFSIRVGFWHKITRLQGSAGRCLHKHHFSPIQKIKYMKRALLGVFFFIFWQLANHRRPGSQKQAGNLYTQKQAAKWSPHAESSRLWTWHGEHPPVSPAASVFPTDTNQCCWAHLLHLVKRHQWGTHFLWRAWYLTISVMKSHSSFRWRSPGGERGYSKWQHTNICPLWWYWVQGRTKSGHQ